MKTLKWIYQLGYKHAESKYYRLLINEINRKQQQFDFIGSQEKQSPDELDKTMAVKYELESIVDNVFKPYIPAPLHPEEFTNRFEL